MRLLYIAPISDDKQTSSGYTNASDGMLDVFTRMKSENLITEITTINNPYSFDIPEETFDICLVNLNIGLLLKKEETIAKYFELKNKCDKIYLSVVWEATPYPITWDELLRSNLFDGYLCPSKFCSTLLETINKPKFYYPHFIDKDIFKPITLEDKKDENVFTVLMLGQLTERKGFKEGIMSFCQELGDKEDCRLIIKSNRMSKYEEGVVSLIQRYSIMNNLDTAQIYSIENKNITQEELVSLYQSSSVVLLPSKGEGFGLNLPETISCGISCIYTKYSAWKDVRYNSFTTYPLTPISVSVENMLHYGYETNMMWGQPLIKDIKSALRNTYNKWKNSKELYYSDSIRSSIGVDTMFGYEAIKKCIMNIFNETEEF